MIRWTALLLVAGLMACGGETTAPAATIAGTWNLQTINGTTMPFVIAQTGANKDELLSDMLVVSGTGSFTQTTTLRSTRNGAASTQSIADAGSYSLNGSAVSFRWNSDNSTGTGSWTGNTLTMAADGFAVVYTR